MKNSMSSEPYQQLVSLLLQLEQEMTSVGQWSSERPSAAALQSTQPFCIDTLSFSQWLQFVFIQRLLALVEQELPLPRLPVGQGISPMAEEFYKNQPDCQSVVGIIKQLDILLSE